MTTAKRAVIGVAAMALVSAVVLQAGSAFALQAKLDKCGADDPATKVRASFDVPHARDIKDFLPGILDNPELRTNVAASVVVFDGPVTLRVAGNPRSVEGATGVGFGPMTYDGVVCVLLGEFRVVYVDVDTSGMRTP